MERIVVATRGSVLALAQTSRVLSLLRWAAPQYEYVRQVVRTRAEREHPLQGAEEGGALVRDLEVAVREGQADLAVHHFKDVPYDLLPGLVIPSVPFRGDPREAFLSNRFASLNRLPDGAMIATHGIRRKSQLLALNPTWRFTELWGSLEQRLFRLQENALDALVLAGYGIDAIGLGERITERVSFGQMLPAAAQGAIALECREEDTHLRKILSFLDDPLVHAAALAERGFYRQMFGGYRVPAGVHAWTEGDRLWVEGLLASPDGCRVRREALDGPLFAPEILGLRLARLLLERGGAEGIVVGL